jgi:hypothetical protein
MFADFADKVQALKSKVPTQLSGGYRSRVGMANGIESGSTDLICLGRSAVIEPNLPAAMILNADIRDSESIAMPHEIKGLWLARMIPVRAVGPGLPIQFFYYNMKLLGAGLPSDPNISLPFIALYGAFGAMQAKLWHLWSMLSTELIDKETMSSQAMGEIVSGKSQIVHPV